MNKVTFPMFEMYFSPTVMFVNIKGIKTFIFQTENYSKLLSTYLSNFGSLDINENIKIIKGQDSSKLYTVYNREMYYVDFNPNIDLLEQHQFLLNYIENYLARVEGLESFK